MTGLLRKKTLPDFAIGHMHVNQLPINGKLTSASRQERRHKGSTRFT